MGQIRVMVVDDSAFMRQTLKGMIEEDSLFTVVTTARNGQDALKKLMIYKPDVITLDIVMGEDMDGLAVLQQIRRMRPTPTIMVSGASDENANYVIDAISNGAFDFICKPSGHLHDIDRIEKELQLKLKEAVLSGKKHENEIASASNDWARDSGRSRDYRQRLAPQQTTLLTKHPGRLSRAAADFRAALPLASAGLIFIGTSTGGPKALQEVVPRLAKDLPVPVLIVQHMPPRFTQSLAQRLNQMSALTVSEAQEGEILEQGHAYIAPGGRHLQLVGDERHYTVHLLDTPSVHGVRPAIDVTLESLLKLTNRQYTVAILTGMGRDGADGLKALKEHNAQVFAIAEDEQSCVVFGMPKAAIETGKIDQIVALQDVASAINDRFVK